MFDHINQIPHWGLLRVAFIAAVLCAAGLIAGLVALLRTFRRNRRQLYNATAMRLIGSGAKLLVIALLVALGTAVVRNVTEALTAALGNPAAALAARGRDAAHPGHGETAGPDRGNQGADASRLPRGA
jgi:hypothetical protein